MGDAEVAVFRGLGEKVGVRIIFAWHPLNVQLPAVPDAPHEDGEDEGVPVHVPRASPVPDKLGGEGIDAEEYGRARCKCLSAAVRGCRRPGLCLAGGLRLDRRGARGA